MFVAAFSSKIASFSICLLLMRIKLLCCTEYDCFVAGENDHNSVHSAGQCPRWEKNDCSICRQRRSGSDCASAGETLFPEIIILYCSLQYNLNGSNTDGSFTVDDSNFFQSLQNSSNSSKKKIFRDFFSYFLFHRGIVCCVYSLESPHRGDSNEYTQHTIIV